MQFYGFVAEKIAALNMDPKFLDRNVNEGFSGGEKKRNEILQLSVRSNVFISAILVKVIFSVFRPVHKFVFISHFISHSRYYNEVKSGLSTGRVLTGDGDEQVLEADMAILDEIDSGLDIDALRDVANAVVGLKKDNNAILMITHYQRLLDYITPTFVHIMVRYIPT